MPTAREWIDGYAERLGVATPTDDEFTALLELAAEAAHASERVAAPVACWLAARAARPLDEALAVAQEPRDDETPAS
jgi:uncharacterized protein (DUF934 family)